MRVRGSRTDILCAMQWRLAVSLAIVLTGTLACGGGDSNSRPEAPDVGTAPAGATKAPASGSRQSGELGKALEGYAPDEFWNEFKPLNNSTNTEYTDESGTLPRWCDDFAKSCGFKARALKRSVSIELDMLPQYGVVMGVYRFSASFVTEEVGYKMKKPWIYFLVVAPAAAQSKTEARWRMIGIRPGGSGERHLIPANGWGVYKSCEGAVVHDYAEAGFESCEKRRLIALRADSLGVSFHEALEQDREQVLDLGITNWLRGAVSSRDQLTAYTGGPLDFAWTTCAAGCCQATY